MCVNKRVHTGSTWSQAVSKQHNYNSPYLVSRGASTGVGAKGDSLVCPIPVHSRLPVLGSDRVSRLVVGHGWVPTGTSQEPAVARAAVEPDESRGGVEEAPLSMSSPGSRPGQSTGPRCWRHTRERGQGHTRLDTAFRSCITVSELLDPDASLNSFW